MRLKFFCFNHMIALNWPSALKMIKQQVWMLLKRFAIIISNKLGWSYVPIQGKSWRQNLRQIEATAKPAILRRNVCNFLMILRYQLITIRLDIRTEIMFLFKRKVKEYSLVLAIVNLLKNTGMQIDREK